MATKISFITIWNSRPWLTVLFTILSAGGRWLMNRQQEHDIRRKLKVLSHAGVTGNVSHTCRYLGVSWDTFYRWKRDYSALGDEGLVNSKPCPENPKIRVASDIEEKILYLRRNYHFGQQKISWYLKQCLDSLNFLFLITTMLKNVAAN